jgi:hypothetical protein
LNQLPSSLAAGNDYLLAQVVDPVGLSNFAPLSQTIQVLAPSVVLNASLSPVRPTIVHVGKAATIVVTIINNGNVDTSGSLSLALSAAIDGVSPGTPLISVMKIVKLTLHRHHSYALHFNAASLSAGIYQPFLQVSLGAANTSAVGPSFTML